MSVRSINSKESWYMTTEGEFGLRCCGEVSRGECQETLLSCVTTGGPSPPQLKIACIYLAFQVQNVSLSKILVFSAHYLLFFLFLRALQSEDCYF